MPVYRRTSLFNIVNPLLLAVLSLLMALPVVNIIAQSFSGSAAINAGDVYLWPVDFTASNYAAVLQEQAIWRAFGISVFVTVVGTLLNLIMTSALAYPLSRQEYEGKQYVLLLVLVTMIFHAPLIPNYLLIRQLGMLDTLWALMLPGAISAFNLFIMRAFFLSIPVELIDSARMDGAGEMRTLWSIILPLSKPVLATLGIYYAVSHWNNYSGALFYLNNRKLYPLQVKLREFVITDTSTITDVPDSMLSSPEGIKMAVIVIATVPIMLVYPFLQKYFIKGMLIGSVKS